jgi:signal transduction histidine kinase
VLPLFETLAGKLAAWRRWLVLMLLVCCIPAALASESSLVRSQGWLEDKDGTMSLEQVQASSFTAFSGILNKGYTKSVYWVRMQIAPHPTDKTIRLRIRPTFIDDIVLYETTSDDPSHWTTRVSGDIHSPYDDERGMNSLGFMIQPTASGSTYYLRIASVNSMIGDIEALTLAEGTQKDSLLALWHFSFFSFILFTLGWGLMEFFQTWKRTLLLFAIYQAVNFLYGFSIMGYLSLIEPRSLPGISDTLASLLAMLVTFFGSLFHLSFIHAYRPNQWLYRIACALLVFPAALPFIFLMGWKQIALQMNILCVLQIGITMLILAYSIKTDPRSQRYIRNLYIIVFLTTIMVALPLWGTVSSSEFRLQSGLIHGLFVSALIFHTLRLRSKARKLLLEQSKVELQQQKQFSEQQGRFIDMLTHEIKTPLTVATMNLDAMRLNNVHSERIQRALGTINQIVERTRLSDLMEHERMLPQLRSTSLPELIHACINGSHHPQRIHASIPENHSVTTDPTFLSIIVSNLIDNALKYGREDAAIALTLTPGMRRNDNGFIMRIKNEIGTSGTPDQKQLFEKYYRHPLAQGKSGSGLGLYLSKKIAQLLNCDLTLNTTDTTVEAILWIPA